MEDGTVSIFGLVLGVAATTNDNKTVLIAGATGAFAAAVSMMAGTYLEIETDRDRAAGLAEAQAALVTDLVRSKPALLHGVASTMTAPEAPAATESPLAH